MGWGIGSEKQINLSVLPHKNEIRRQKETEKAGQMERIKMRETTPKILSEITSVLMTEICQL